MTINSLQDLQQLIRLCRKNGIDSIKLGDVELKFGFQPKTIPAVHKRRQIQTDEPFNDPGPIHNDAPIDTEELSPEALLFWSSEDKLGAQEPS